MTREALALYLALLAAALLAYGSWQNTPAQRLVRAERYLAQAEQRLAEDRAALRVARERCAGGCAEHLALHLEILEDSERTGAEHVERLRAAARSLR